MTRRIGAGLALLGLLLAAVWVSTGWSAAVLLSPSMEPFASPGDLLVHRQVPARDIAVGDVVTLPTRGDRLGTHRVVRLSESGPDVARARLKGDASPLPDPRWVPLRGDVARVVAVLPGIGGVLTAGGPLLWGGFGLLVLGGGVLAAARRQGARGMPAPDERGTPAPAATTPAPDSRVVALLSTCEQLAEDGLPDDVLRDLVRVRTADLLGLPPAERAGAVLTLDDGARFYVSALADVEPDALALVPPGSSRRLRASAALDQWWQIVGQRVPTRVAEQVAPWVDR